MFKLTSRSRVAVIGAGPAGLCAAAKLKQIGCQTRVFERAAQLGGTWRYTDDPRKGDIRYRF